MFVNIIEIMRKVGKTKKVISTMFGGIDSSVITALLKRVGLDVVGVFMNFEFSLVKID